MSPEQGASPEGAPVPLAPAPLASPPAPAPPQLWPSVVVLLVALVFSGLFGGLVVGFFVGTTVAAGGDAGALLSDPKKLLSEPLFLFASIVAAQVALAVPVLFLPRLLKDVDGGSWLERVRWRAERFSLVDLLVTTLGTLGVGTFTMAIVHAVAPNKGPMLEALDAASRGMSPPLFAVFVLFGSLGAGLGEEATFRGLLQTRLVQRLGPTAGIVIAAAVFGAWHFDVVHSPVAMMLGLWLGWCAHRQGTIATVALAHALNNATSFILTRLSAPEPEKQTWLALGLGGGVVALCALVVYRRTSPAVATDGLARSG